MFRNYSKILWCCVPLAIIVTVMPFAMWDYQNQHRYCLYHNQKLNFCSDYTSVKQSAIDLRCNEEYPFNRCYIEHSNGYNENFRAETRGTFLIYYEDEDLRLKQLEELLLENIQDGKVTSVKYNGTGIFTVTVCLDGYNCD